MDNDPGGIRYDYLEFFEFYRNIYKTAFKKRYDYTRPPNEVSPHVPPYSAIVVKVSQYVVNLNAILLKSY